MTQRTYLQYKKQTHRHREQICGFQGVGEVKEGWIGSLELADENLYRMDKQKSPTI